MDRGADVDPMCSQHREEKEHILEPLMRTSRLDRGFHARTRADKMRRVRMEPINPLPKSRRYIDGHSAACLRPHIQIRARISDVEEATRAIFADQQISLARTLQIYRVVRPVNGIKKAEMHADPLGQCLVCRGDENGSATIFPPLPDVAQTCSL